MAFIWKILQNGSDIRGVAIDGVPGEEVNLTADRVRILGKAFYAWLMRKGTGTVSPGKIAVGRDSRLSGPELSAAFIEGLTCMGANVLDTGLASTPAMFMSTVMGSTRCDGAVMLTASHLPFNRNGMKFFTANGGLDKQDISDILKIAEEDNFEKVRSSGKVIDYDLISDYSDHLISFIRKGISHSGNFDQPLKGARIIVDAGNGAGGFFATRVLVSLGAEISGSQYLDPDGNFPNHSPNPEDTKAIDALRNAVLDNQADMGIIFDTDVDRAALVDRSGKPVNRNRLIALISAIILDEHPHSTIVTDSITSEGLASFISNHLEGVHHRFKRGYRNVINEAVRLNRSGRESWLAIETSGHAALKENYFLDDGAYLMAKILIEFARLKLQGDPIETLLSGLDEPAESEEFRLKVKVDNFKEAGNRILSGLQQYADQVKGWHVVKDNHEGVRVSCNKETGNGWFLLRLSLHDPVLPLNVESEEPGGCKVIALTIHHYLKNFPELDLTPLVDYVSI